MKGELLYLWSQLSLDVLIPKQRGAGYLKVPLGDHYDRALANLELSIPKCQEICGLDGYLCIGFDWAPTESDERKRIEDIVRPQLFARYKCTKWREVTHEQFFEILQP